MVEKQDLSWPAGEMAQLVRVRPELRLLIEYLERLARSVSAGNRTDLVYDLANLAGDFDDPTGALSRTTFDPASVTLEELAERVAAHLVDHKAKET